MSKVVFESKQSNLSVAHESLFHCGVIMCPPYKAGVSPLELDIEALREMGIKAPEMYNRTYMFMEGENHNQLTLETEEEIEAMREFIKANPDIVEIGE